MSKDLDALKARLRDTSLTVSRIRNVVTEQNRFVVFNEQGAILIEARHEVTAAWIDGYLKGKHDG